MAGARSVVFDGDSFEVDGARFVVDYFHRSTPDLFCIRKPVPLVEAYFALVALLGPQNIVELGIAGGGSTALLALVSDPKKLVAVELDEEPIVGLSSLVEARGLDGRVRTFYGVDQADRPRVREIVQEEFGTEPLDLVVDDASHLLAETLASFEVLFPLLRPGGMYIIEDWAAHHTYADALVVTSAADALNPSPPARPTLEKLGRLLHADDPNRFEPVTRMVVQLVLARASSGDAISEIVVDGHWIAVRRGEGDLDPDRFRLADLYTDHFGLTTAAPPAVP